MEGPLLRVRVASRRDFSYLCSMTSAEGWGYCEEDFIWFEDIGGKTLVAVEGCKIIGIVTILDYGNAGWISNLLVRKKERGHGVGSLLVKESMRRFNGKRTVALFSYGHSLGFYEEHGFKRDSDAYIVSLRGPFAGSCGVARVNSVTDDMIALDSECFGFARPALLRGLGKKGELLVQAEGSGFAIARPDPVEPMAGPVVASNRASGLELLYVALAVAGQGARALVLEEGIKDLNYEGKISRLYQGDPPKIDRKRAFAFAGLELG